MNNLNDMEKLDSVFRSAATDYELPYDEGAWGLMQQKLDVAFYKKKKRGIWWWFPVAIFAIGTVAYIYTKQPNNNTLANTTSKSTSENVDTQKSNIDNNKNVTSENNSNENNNAKTNESTNSQAPKEISNSKLLTINTQNNSFDHNENISIKKGSKASNSSRQGNSILSTERNDEIPKNASSGINQNSINDKQAIASKSNLVDNTLQSISGESSTNMYTANILYMHNRYIPNFKELEKENIAIVAKRDSFAKELAKEENRTMIRPIVPSLPTYSDWFLTAYLGNNIGYVSNPQISNGHLQYQIGFGYNLNRNVSFQTGVIFGNRTFDMRKDQFSYKGPGAYEKYIRNINADVSVIDIPITLRYQFSDKENFGWFTTFGISTVFLKKENYIITVDNGSSITYLYQNFENTPSVLSMLNLSLGYQYALNKKITLTAEPYIQLPFKSIGEGGSKLCSVGLQIGAKYNLPKKKK